MSELKMREKWAVCPACDRILPAEIPTFDTSMPATIEEHHERDIRPFVISRCLNNNCRMIWDIFATSIEPQKPVHSIEYKCEKCSPDLKGFEQAVDGLESFVPDIIKYKNGAFNEEIVFICSCGKQIDVIDLAHAVASISAFKERLQQYAEKVAEVGSPGEDCFYSMAYSVNSVFFDQGAMSETSFERYLKYVRVVDFDHFTDELETICEIMDELEKHNKYQHARLLACLLRRGGQHLDELLDIKHHLQAVDCSVFVASLLPEDIGIHTIEAYKGSMKKDLYAACQRQLAGNI
jgi:hypothetical protein